MQTDSIVYVVDDDVSVRQGLDSLFRSAGYTTFCFGSVADFAAHVRSDRPSCLVLDVRMPGRSGLDFQGELKEKNDALPIIFLTGHGDVPMSVRAMKAGAIEFLLKPFREQDLLDAVQAGINFDSKRRKEDAACAELVTCFSTLSAREREVLDMVTNGHSNKDIGRALNLKEVTIKVHRGNAMKKMKTGSLAELVRKVERLAKVRT